VSYLAFHSRTGTVHLTGREVRHIGALATEALATELSLPEHQLLRADLGLPAVHSRSFGLQVLWLMSDGEPHRVQGRDIYLCDLALNVLYRHRPAAGILCWLYDKALIHGWVAAADRSAMAEQLQAALNAGVARAKMADQRPEHPGVLLPAGSRGGWEEVIAFLRSGTGDVVTSMSLGRAFPHYEPALIAGVWQPRLAGHCDAEDDLDRLWGQLGCGQQWDLCMRALRDRPSLQWRPGGESYLFGAFTILPRAGLMPSGPALSQ
jgi:hypothetical protein